ncbi:G2/mitotic-specific cyclin-2-like [Andrographis paniculata]|uniref:G2/mitotic-specific cyclin-2-like n=1 Tax=Andrographis paniculata TaxID=175694 RepID=UPI0021E7F271|nr:G2/mitotic-specific cyclin-2-like [Andrographis paniculata]
MESMDENFPGLIRPPSSNNQGGLRGEGGVVKCNGNGNGGGSKRRALSTIDMNILGAHPPYHSNKRGHHNTAAAAACNNKPPVAVPPRRPITRKFAAQLAEEKDKKPSIQIIELLQEEDNIRSIAHLVSTSSRQSEDCIIIDATDDDHSKTEQKIEEVEMEDIINEEDDEPVIDIDAGCKNNPLAVTEYIDDLYSFYKKTEGLSCVSPSYMMSRQFDINERMRAILVDWLIEVHYKFELAEETLYLTVNLIDRFLSVQSVVRKKLQLVGVTAMLLACKYEEVSVPVVEDFILITDKAYTRKEVLEMEKLMINTLQFNLSLPTSYVFMTRYLRAAQADRRMEVLSFYVMELCLVEYEMLRFAPSMLAAGAVFTAQCTLSGHRQWSKTCERYTGYTQDDLLECAKMMVRLHEKAASGKGNLSAVYKKYSTAKYGYAARFVQPALFLIQEEEDERSDMTSLR